MSLRIIYTYQLKGQLGLLPPLYTYLTQLIKADPSDHILLDLGQSCQPDIWHCQVTSGQSCLTVLDGMGYTAAHTDGLLQPAIRQNLQKHMAMHLVDQNHPFEYSYADQNLCIASNPASNQHTLTIALKASPANQIKNGILHLKTIEQGEIGLVWLALTPTIHIHHATTERLPDKIAPSPVISATVDFVESEARFVQKRQNQT